MICTSLFINRISAFILVVHYHGYLVALHPSVYVQWCWDYWIFIYIQFNYSLSSSWWLLNIIQIKDWLYITLFRINTSIIYCNMRLSIFSFESSFIKTLPCDAFIAVWHKLQKCISKVPQTLKIHLESSMFNQFIQN